MVSGGRCAIFFALIVQKRQPLPQPRDSSTTPSTEAPTIGRMASTAVPGSVAVGGASAPSSRLRTRPGPRASK